MVKEGRKKPSTPSLRYQQHNATLREEKSGKKDVKGVKTTHSIMRMKHLQKLASWAGGEGSVPPLAAYFGQRFAATAEAIGVAPDSSLYPCQRCETILQPGYNCTVRIEKNTSKRRKRKKLLVPPQNNVVYTCQFCQHHNLKRGTPKGHMREILAMRPEPLSNSKSVHPNSQMSASIDRDINVGEESNPLAKTNSNIPKKVQASSEINDHSPASPVRKVGIVVPEDNRNSSALSSNKTTRPNNVFKTETGIAKSGSSKRKRKGWSSLRDIAASSEQDNSRSFGNLTIPFFLGTRTDSEQN